MIKRKHVYVGDYVRLNDTYFQEWTNEKPSRLDKLRDTVFRVVETCRCYSWSLGVGGGGILLTLEPFYGPLTKENLRLGRGDSSVEIVDPVEVDQLLAQKPLEQQEKNS